jgi:hypothetical protein
VHKKKNAVTLKRLPYSSFRFDSILTAMNPDKAHRVPE